MTDVPKPLLAAVGALSQVRTLPARAFGFGVSLLGVSYKLREDYTALAARGQQVVNEVFGGGETPEMPVVPAPPEHVVEEESAAVLEAVAHVEDPLDRPRTLPEPIPGYDEMTLGSLRGRLRSLSPEDVTRTLTYERAYLARQPMMTLLEHRAAKLAAG